MNTALTDQQKDYSTLSIFEKWEFMGKLVIAAQHGYFSECSEIVNRAQSEGLYERIKPVNASHEQIKDLDNPIHNNSTDLQ